MDVQETHNYNWINTEILIHKKNHENIYYAQIFKDIAYVEFSVIKEEWNTYYCSRVEEHIIQGSCRRFWISHWALFLCIVNAVLSLQS
jgi:hypothetical protein